MADTVDIGPAVQGESRFSDRHGGLDNTLRRGRMLGRPKAAVDAPGPEAVESPQLRRLVLRRGLHRALRNPHVIPAEAASDRTGPADLSARGVERRRRAGLAARPRRPTCGSSISPGRTAKPA